MGKRKNRDEAALTVACIQMEIKVGDRRQNINHSLELIDEAAGNGAQLIVLPELANSGYVFENRSEAFDLSESVPDGESCRAWAEACSRHNAYIIAGISERDGTQLYNSAVLLGPQGYIGTFRKLHLWNDENLYFEPGNMGYPVFRTPLGRIGICICYDCWFPESFRMCALQGADIVCVPTNWVPIPGQRQDREAMANVLVMAAAHTNSIYIACANRIGVERGQPFIGQSIIAEYTGWPIAGPASANKEEVLLAELNLADARRKRNWNEYNQPLRDRRTDVYEEMLGSKVQPGWY